MKISNLKDRTDLGTIIAFAGHDLPEGYLECDGTQYNITDQLALYLTIGLTYGGNLTGLPANLDWMTTDEVTIISKSSSAITLRLHRERGLMGLPTTPNSDITVRLGGVEASTISYDEHDMNTGIITVTAALAGGWSISSWYASLPSSGTYSASNFVTFSNEGSPTLVNTGFAGTFNVPNLNSGQTIAGGSSNTITSNIGIRNESIGANNHQVGGLTVGVNGSATINGNGTITNNTVTNNVNTSPTASANLQQITHSINMMREHQHMFLLPGLQHAVRGRNANTSSRNETKVSVRRNSSNNQTDQLHDTSSAGSNNNNKHNHSLTINKSGNLDCGVNPGNWGGNTTGNLDPSTTPVNLSVKTRQIVVKYLIKSI